MLSLPSELGFDAAFDRASYSVLTECVSSEMFMFGRSSFWADIYFIFIVETLLTGIVLITSW